MTTKTRATAPAWAQFARRFWSKVDRSGECWLWMGSRHQHGYGRMRVGSRRDGSRRLELATHIVWELTNGPISEGMWVLHHCDNPPCVRPEHLFLGTHAENMYDMIAKGRARHPSLPGESCGHAKLTEAAALLIRARVAAGEMQKTLAAEFGVSRATVCLVVGGKRWAA